MLSAPAYKTRTYFAAGTVFLLLGVSVYVIDRPPGNILFLTNYVTIFAEGFTFFGRLGEFLPSLCHVIGFSLITFSLYPSRWISIIAPLFWGGVNLIFELAQLPFLVSRFTPLFSENSYAISANDLGAYVSYGTFDFLDMGAILAGTITCILLLHNKRNWRPK